MLFLDDAIIKAVEMHKGQVDWAGVPYILHALSVMNALKTAPEEYLVTAVLHDTIEDTPLTIQDLFMLDYPDAVISALEAITHQDEEKYFDYIKRLAQNPIAREVKLADLKDNHDRCVLWVKEHPDQKGSELYKKFTSLPKRYIKARKMLVGN